MGLSVIQRGSLGIGPLDERAVTANESAPTTNENGISVFGYSRVVCSVVLDDATSVVLRPYVYDSAWVRVADSSGAPVSYTITSDVALVFDIAGYERFILLCSTTDGDLNINSRPCGPNL
jgi:hypothetical protein